MIKVTTLDVDTKEIAEYIVAGRRHGFDIRKISPTKGEPISGEVLEMVDGEPLKVFRNETVLLEGGHVLYQQQVPDNYSIPAD